MNQKKPDDMGLLEYLAAKAGCMYLSDLHQPVYSCMVGRTIARMNVDAYRLSEWNDAVQYITGEAKLFEDKVSAAEYLQRYAPERKEQEEAV